jgi:NAD dependent epimerase/dehydratase
LRPQLIKIRANIKHILDFYEDRIDLFTIVDIRLGHFVDSASGQMSTVLVTGADGFIGSHLTESLVRAGYRVKAFVNYNSFNSWGWLDSCAEDVKGNFEVCMGDIRDPNGVKVAMQGCDSVLHLAALIAIPFSYNSPDTYLETNVKGTLNILQAARELGVSRIVHTSTSEVYGSAQYVPIDESHPLSGQSPYSATKIAADQMAYSFYSSFGLPVVILRPFNTYGPRQSARAVIPTIISQIANGNRNIKLGTLSPTRDFSYVKDTVDGFIAALQSKRGLGEFINLGSNFEISIGQTANLIANLMGKEVEFSSDAERIRPTKSEVTRLWADNRKAFEMLGWKPEFNGLEGFKRGLTNTIEWFIRPEIQSKYKPDIYNI